MIVKIKHINSWIFYDKLEKVRYDKASIVEFIDDVPDVSWINEKSGSTDAVLLKTRKINDTEFIILANETVYLLNDEGKTIERIN